MNALNSQTLRELTQAVRDNADQRVIILTGAGDRAFVAGADISEMAPMTPWAAREFSELGHVATALLKQGDGKPWLICAYIVFAGVVSALSAWWIGRRPVVFDEDAVAAA